MESNKKGPTENKHFPFTSLEKLRTVQSHPEKAWCSCAHGCWCMVERRENRAGLVTTQNHREPGFSEVATRHLAMVLRLCPHPPAKNTGPQVKGPLLQKPAFHSLSCSLILGFFHFRKEDKADGGDGCTTVRMYLMPPNCTLKMANKSQRMYTSQ